MSELLKWVHCSACDARTLCDATALILRLRAVGMLRRDTEPGIEILEAILPEAARRLVCDKCGAQSIRILESELSEDDWGEGEWGELRRCEQCNMPIPAERLEVFPTTTRCAKCQSQSESSGGDTLDPEYCPRCGSLLEMTRTKGSGISRYRMYCRNCGRS